MRFAFALALLAAGCSADDNRPIGPGGGVGGGGGTAVDGGAGADGGNGSSISGRLCLVSDLRVPNLCPTTGGIGGIEIENVFTGAKTTSNDNGSFTLPGTSGDYAQLRATFNESDYRDVIVPIGLIAGQAIGVQVPLVPNLVWEDLLFVVGMNEPNGTASLAAYMKKPGGLVTNVSMQAPEGTSGTPIYDGPEGPNDWNAGGGTGQFGAAILMGIPADTASLSIGLLPLGGELVNALGVPTEANVLTFITVPLP